MKLIIQIPCYNEAETLADVVASLPSHIDNISSIETLVIDDGSEDGTADIAHAAGVDHVVRHPRNLGLARAFQTGIETCLNLGADIIVNTDADDQYPARYIPELIEPVRMETADIVIGDRQVYKNPHFSPLKRRLQSFGSWTVRAVSNTDVPDTVSGFRAYSREAALRLNILSNFSYTLDTIIQAGRQGLSVTSIPIETNAATRPSRLQKNKWHFMKRQGSTILRLYAFYEPLRTFTYIALPFLAVGIILLGRFAYFYLRDLGQGHIQSVIIGTGSLLVGLFIALFGVQADITSKHRQLTQETLYRLRKLELNSEDEGKYL